MIGRIARHGFLIASTCAVAAPFVWMLLLSAAPPEIAARGAVTLAIDPGAIGENYGRALTETGLPRYLLNGVVVSAAALASQLFFGAPLAFALAKGSFLGRRLILALVIAGLLLPQEVVALPLFFMAYRLDVLDTYAGLVLPSLISPTAVFLLYQVFRTIPDDLIHASRLDGASSWTIVWRLMMPMCAPTVAAISILSVVARWNDLFWPTIAVTSQSLMPPPMGLLSFRDEEAGTSYGPLMAAATLTTMPLIIAFLLAQKRFIESFSAGARA